MKTLNYKLNADLTETVGKTYINSAQDARLAAVSLMHSDLTPNDFRNELRGILGQIEINPFPVESKLMVAQILCELLNSEHTPDDITETIFAVIETVKALYTNNGDSVLKFAGYIQMLDDSDAKHPTLYLDGVDLTFDEEQKIMTTLKKDGLEAAKSALNAIKNHRQALSASNGHKAGR